MDATGRGGWVRAALLAGVVYFLIGRVFALPASHAQAWRLAAWLVSGCVYSAHIWYERFALRTANRLAALHVAAAVAIGAFVLAVAGMIHSLSTTSALRPVWLLALMLWPVFTAVPAFVGALVAGALLRRFTTREAGAPGRAG